MADVEITINFRPYQRQLHEGRTRFSVWNLHRRAGKTFLASIELFLGAIGTNRKDWRGFYICPTFTAAKAIAFDMLKGFSRDIPGVSFNEAELRIDYPNGSRIQLLGAEKYDSLRGRYADAVVFDETAQIAGAAWHTVISPMLADRLGWAIFIGTPQGRMNLFWEVYEFAGGARPVSSLGGGNGNTASDWSRATLTYQDTNALQPGEIERMRALMTPEAFAQELECSWNAAHVGAFYGPQMAAAEARTIDLLPDLTSPIYVALDLGWSDAMACIFFQTIAGQTRILHAQEWERTAIPQLVQAWKELPFPIAGAILPHDARVHELGTGLSRQEVFHNLGVPTFLAPNQDLHEGIAQVRDALALCWFNRAGTKALREALGAYRSSYDEVRLIHSKSPVHDFSSHFADAMRYLVLGRPANQAWGPRPAYQLPGVSRYA